ncbi:TadE/TadG family type IV pilus assembly protein [Erythrobacter sp. SD-21]|uniref:TadE/TadG family type IV pilus assembly protein n=1 Tax=Erythrobacter sp. SD-21 TaxID=161528 RepID=UPI000153FC02|nr:TadE family protein [Erythrobacter sp. SD-21]EDL50335.1 TadE-like protein [Erythrobacter sp. SD-21]
MIRMLRKLAAIRRNENGSVVIETAIVLPVLVLMALGGFETSRIVSRESELQAAIAEGAAVVLATFPEDQEELDTIEEIIEASTGLPDGKVRLLLKYRCNSDASLQADESSCPTGAVISEIIQINIWDTYDPIWTEFGVGGTVRYDIMRRVQIS